MVIIFTVLLLFSPPVTISSARFPHYAKYTSFHRSLINLWLELISWKSYLALLEYFRRKYFCVKYLILINLFINFSCRYSGSWTSWIELYKRRDRTLFQWIRERRDNARDNIVLCCFSSDFAAALSLSRPRDNHVKKGSTKCQKFAIRTSFALRPFACPTCFVGTAFCREARHHLKSTNILLPTLHPLCTASREHESPFEGKKEDFATRAECRWKAERRPFRRLRVIMCQERETRVESRHASPGGLFLRTSREFNEPGQACRRSN